MGAKQDIMNRRTVSVPDWNASMLDIARLGGFVVAY